MQLAVGNGRMAVDRTWPPMAKASASTFSRICREKRSRSWPRASPRFAGRSESQRVAPRGDSLPVKVLGERSNTILGTQLLLRPTQPPPEWQASSEALRLLGANNLADPLTDIINQLTARAGHLGDRPAALPVYGDARSRVREDGRKDETRRGESLN